MKKNYRFKDLIDVNNIFQKNNILPLLSITGTFFAYFSIVILNFGDYSRYAKNENELSKGNFSLVLNLIIFSFFSLFITMGADLILNNNITNAEKILTNFRSNLYIDLIGISVHIGSQITSIVPFKKAFFKIKNFVNKINKNKRIIKYLDLGGGIGINYNNNKTINFNDYVKIIKNISNNLQCKLILEPGRFLIADSGILVTKVLYIKKSKKINFAIIDAGMNDLLRPALYDAYHEINNINKNNGKKNYYTIVGPVCESADIFSKKILMNKIKTNDFLFIKNVGAYGASMSSSYNSRPIIMELIINKNKYSIIRKTDTVINQISREKIPSWAKKIK